MSNPEQMQQAMSQMMNNPMMQSVLNDPEMLRNMFSSNPAIQQVNACFGTCWQKDFCWQNCKLVCKSTKLLFWCLQLMDRNPEFAQVLNNPQQLQEAMQAASNPVSSISAVHCVPD